jgi:hypothetical protein
MVVCFLLTGNSLAQGYYEGDKPYLKDRGTGTPTSMFGTYVHKSELLAYLYFEYYLDNDMEYEPLELGYGLEQEYRGKFRASEGLFFLGYGITEDLMIEVEVAVIEATLEKASDDTATIPDKITESGLGDTQTLISWRWMRETAHRPMFFSFLEVVFPFQEDKVLIGTPDWEFKFGTGVTRGFSFGTMTLRAAVEHDAAEEVTELGEVAVEYLKRLSRTWRIYLGVEGAQDEIELITEAQLHLSDRVFIKLNNAFGLTSKATDWAPEVGIMFSFPTR